MDEHLNLDPLIETLSKGKKRINSRQKGAAYERKIAKLLNTKFDSKEFSRSPGSGAFATTHNLPEHLHLHGDILTPKKFKFVIECKCGYNHIDLFDLFLEDKELDNFLRQTRRDSKAANKPFLLIYKKTGSRRSLVITSMGLFAKYLPDFKRVDVPKKNITIQLLDEVLALPNSAFIEE